MLSSNSTSYKDNLFCTAAACRRKIGMESIERSFSQKHPKLRYGTKKRCCTVLQNVVLCFLSKVSCLSTVKGNGKDRQIDTAVALL
jgi:hypothetical protein